MTLPSAMMIVAQAGDSGQPREPSIVSRARRPAKVHETGQVAAAPEDDQKLVLCKSHPVKSARRSLETPRGHVRLVGREIEKEVAYRLHCRP